MSLSEDAVLKVLKDQFVCGFKNIKGQCYAGGSGENDPDAAAIRTTNGAGPHNMQIFLLNSDGIVLHCLLGFWLPQDLLYEIDFAMKLDKIWRDGALSLDEKKAKFKESNLQIIAQLPQEMKDRSLLQDFDTAAEHSKADSDFKLPDYAMRHSKPQPCLQSKKHRGLKSTVQVIHERMAQSTFLAYEEFGVEKFSDYGLMFYHKYVYQKSPTEGQVGALVTAGQLELFKHVIVKNVRPNVRPDK